MYHGISSRDYLSRAQERLREGKLESLFYAAFELRCGIESRMQQYLNAQEFVSKSKKKGWQIAKLGKNIEQVFKMGDRVAEFAVIEKETGSIIDKFYYTPVTSKLREMGERLGDLLHAMKKSRKEDDKWWYDTRKYLEGVCQELAKANAGTLLGVPLIKKETGQLYMNIEILRGEDPNSLRDKVGQIGVQRILKVRYLHELPPDAVRIKRTACHRIT